MSSWCSWGFVMLSVLGGCQRGDAPRRVAPPQVAPDPLPAIERVSRFAEDRAPDSPYDCTIIAALQTHFAGLHVQDCGEMPLHASPDAVARAARCMTDAVAARRPMLLAQQLQGVDSGVVHAYLTRMEGSAYVGYSADYDSDPCGGGCPERGHTTIERCAAPPRADTACADGEAACLTCDAGSIVTRCTQGAPSHVSLAEAERARDALFGPTPTSLALGALQLGAPYAAWHAPEAAREISAVAAGGIAWVATPTDNDAPSAQILAIGLELAGPCDRVRAQLVAKWGEPRDGEWLDAADHRRAHLDAASCELRVERYADLDTWIADSASAPIPLAAIGTPAAELGRRVGARPDPDELRWSAPGIGTSGGLVEIVAYIEHGRVRSLEATGDTDATTAARLRDRVAALPRDPPVQLQLTANGHFDLSVGADAQ